MKCIKARNVRESVETTSLENRVREILHAIKTGGKEALLKLVKELDGYEGPLKVRIEEMDRALKSTPPALLKALERAIKNIRSFHRAQRNMIKETTLATEKGVIAGIRFAPVESAAVYIPSGRYPLPSTVLMSVIPAQEAQVPRIVALSPARGTQGIHPTILAALRLLGVEEVYAMGGAHGIGAVAYGVEGIRPVEFVVGPGNVYVTEAKRQLFGTIGIDGLAGPSEVLIIADETSNPSYVAADLLAQSEHDPLARSVLFSTSETLAEEVLKYLKLHLKTIDKTGSIEACWNGNGEIYVGTINEAIDFANEMAPEHLELSIANADAYVERFKSYGAVFLGCWSAEAFGDYIAGTNHILPTAGTARWNGALWTGTFMRPQYMLKLEREGAASLSKSGQVLASKEGLLAHKLSMELRGETND